MAAPVLLIGGSWTNPDWRVVIEATAPKSAGTLFVSSSEYKVLVDFDGDDVNPVDVGAQYADKFGVLPQGARVFVRIYSIAKNGVSGAGLASDFTESSAIIT